MKFTTRGRSFALHLQVCQLLQIISGLQYISWGTCTGELSNQVERCQNSIFYSKMSIHNSFCCYVVWYCKSAFLHFCNIKSRLEMMLDNRCSFIKVQYNYFSQKNNIYLDSICITDPITRNVNFEQVLSGMWPYNGLLAKSDLKSSANITDSSGKAAVVTWQ